MSANEQDLGSAEDKIRNGARFLYATTTLSSFECQALLDELDENLNLQDEVIRLKELVEDLREDLREATS